LVVGAIVAAYGCFWSLPGVFQIWNAQTVDSLFLIRSNLENLRPAYKDMVVHLDFNNSSIERLGHHYLSRKHVAGVVKNLSAMGVSAQAFDFIFADRLNASDDLALVDAVKEAGDVYFGIAFELLLSEDTQKEEPRPSKGSPFIGQIKWNISFKGKGESLYEGINPLSTYPDLALASRGLGSLSVKFDRDGVLRRVPLLVRYQQGFYPSLAFRVICDHLRVPPENIVLHPGKHLILRNAKRPGAEERKDITIPIDENCNMIVNYLGPWGTMNHYSFADILYASEDQEGLKIWREELKDRIIIVSDVTTGSSDVGPVPTDAHFPLSGVHSNIIHNILTESFLRELSGLEMLAIELMMMTIVFILSSRFSSIPFFIGVILLAGTFSGFAAFGFLYQGVILNVIRPLLMLAFVTLAIILFRYVQEEKEKMETLRQRDFIRGTFGRYISNEVVDQLLGSSEEALKMGGETREVTFLVSDLRGFTALTEKLPASKVIPILNRYFEAMVEIIAQYRGTVDELQGDGMLVFFGAPIAADDDPERAVACAIEMQNRMPEINGLQRREGLPEIVMGIGINTGEVMVGNIGSQKRSKYGAVGSAINIAYRIESHTVGGQVLISSATYNKVKPSVQVRGTLDVQFKGMDHPSTLYEVIGIKGTYGISMPVKDSLDFTGVEPPLACRCFLFSGKTMVDESISGCITGITASGVEAALEKELPVHSNLRVLLPTGEEPHLFEFYAKVLSLHGFDSVSSRIKATLGFTWLPDNTKLFLKAKAPGIFRG
jgi:adenylate cyclase